MTRAGRPLFPERSALDQFGYALRKWRQTRSMSQAALGRALHVSGDLLSKVELAERHPTGELARACERLLNAQGEIAGAWEAYEKEQERLLKERARTESAKTGHFPSGPGAAAGAAEWPAFPYPTEDVDELMRRRAFILNAAVLAGLAKSDPVTALQAVRHQIGEPHAPGPDADVSDWGHTVLEYGESYPVTAPSDLLGPLIVDFTALEEAFRRRPHDAVQRELFRTKALLAGFIAQTVNRLGNSHEARHWWRIARDASERAGDSYSPLWVRTREIMHATIPMSGRPVVTILRLIEEAERFVEDAQPELQLELLSAKAQALAIAGRSGETHDALRSVYQRFSAAPFTGYDGTLFGWGEERLRNTESFIFSRLGDYERLEIAQEASASLYKYDPSNYGWPTSNDLNKAYCLVRCGDISGGTAHARSVIDSLPSVHKKDQTLLRRAIEIDRLIPHSEHSRPTVKEYRQWLNSAFSDPAAIAR